MVSVFVVFFYDFLRMLPEFVAAHYLNVAWDGAHRDTIGNAFAVVQSVGTGFNQTFNCPTRILVSQALVDCLITYCKCKFTAVFV